MLIKYQAGVWTSFAGDVLRPMGGRNTDWPAPVFCSLDAGVRVAYCRSSKRFHARLISAEAVLVDEG
jgi:hypothetical protein